MDLDHPGYPGQCCDTSPCTCQETHVNTTTPAPPRIGDPRQHTPDELITQPDGTTVTRVRVKRCCNGCNAVLGDLDDRDVDQHGRLTDVRPECPACTPAVPSAPEA